MGEIAIASMQGGLDDQVSPVFGRCQNFTIIEAGGEEPKEIKIMDNPHASASRGAGMQAAGMIAQEGVEAVIAGNFGPNVFSVFEQSNLRAYLAGEMSVGEAAQKYINGELEAVSADQATAHQQADAAPGGGSQQAAPGQGQSAPGDGNQQPSSGQGQDQTTPGQGGGAGGGAGGGSGHSGGGRGRRGQGRGNR